MKEIAAGLFQGTTYIPAMNFSIHRYLLKGERSIMFATGAYYDAENEIDEVERILDGKPLDYLFVSHVESDECGGLPIYLKRFPSAKVISSRFGCRELTGFGHRIGPIPGGKDGLTDGSLELAFIDYPSEARMQNGLVCFDAVSGVLYSSDLFQSLGKGGVEEASWPDLVDSLSVPRMPQRKLDKLKADLRAIEPRFVAVGHGACIRCVRP